MYIEDVNFGVYLMGLLMLLDFNWVWDWGLGLKFGKVGGCEMWRFMVMNFGIW